MEKAKKTRLVELVQVSLFSALIVMMTFVPYLGYITIPGTLSITTLHIPVILGAVVLKKFRYGFVLGTVWGVTCLIYAWLNGTADAVIFTNPLISVVPRILVGTLIPVYLSVFKKTPKTPVFVSMFFTAVLGTVTNTVLVLTAINMFGQTGLFTLTGVVGQIFSVLIAINGIIELVAAAIIVPACAIPLLRYNDRLSAQNGLAK